MTHNDTYGSHGAPDSAETVDVMNIPWRSGDSTLLITKLPRLAVPRVNREYHLRNLEAAVDEARLDGFVANPAAHQAAREFLSRFPLNLPSPDSISVELDGDIELEWYRSQTYLFSISISEGGRLYYSGIFGAGELSGTDVGDGEVPQIVELALKRFAVAPSSPDSIGTPLSFYRLQQMDTSEPYIEAPSLHAVQRGHFRFSPSNRRSD